MATASEALAPPIVRTRVRKFSFRDPLLYVQAVVLLLLAFLILYPGLILLDVSLRDKSGNLSFVWYIQAYTSARNLAAIWNTIIVATGSALIAAVMGTLLAWAVVRTDMPGRTFAAIAAIVPFITSSFIGALAWVLLGAPEVGLLNQAWRYIGGDGVLLNIYSIEGIIFVIGLHEVPFIFLMVAGALRSMDPSLEEASLSSGAGTWETATKVTLPLVLPAILAGSLVVFVLAAEQFGVPAVLGTPSRIRVLTTSIVSTQAFYPPQRGLGAALSVTLLVIALFGLFLQRMVLRGRSFTTVAGKSSHPRRVRLGPFRWVLFAICTTYLLLAVVLPFATIFVSSIRTIWTSYFSWEQFTLEHYRWVFLEYPLTQRAIVNSLFLAVVGATVTIVFCALISFLSLRTRLPGRNAARLSQHAAARHTGRRARLRDVGGLDQPAARALRHDLDPVHRLHDAVSADRRAFDLGDLGPDPPRARGVVPFLRRRLVSDLPPCHAAAPEARDHRRLDPAVPRVSRASSAPRSFCIPRAWKFFRW